MAGEETFKEGDCVCIPDNPLYEAGYVEYIVSDSTVAVEWWRYADWQSRQDSIRRGNEPHGNLLPDELEVHYIGTLEHREPF